MTKEEEIVGLIADLAKEIALETVYLHTGDTETTGGVSGAKARLAKALGELRNPHG
jgi:hypothetical protein